MATEDHEVKKESANVSADKQENATNLQIESIAVKLSSSQPNEDKLTEILSLDRKCKFIDVPYSLNISAGKNTYVYDAHTYHTKVPPQGIASLIEYYTNPGEVVLDPFCGSGMTGVAALELNRKAVLSDLSPAAVFIAENLCMPIDEKEFLSAIDEIIEQSHDLERKLYTTICRECGKPSLLLYMVWSYGLMCDKCGREFILWDVARDEKEDSRKSKIKKEFDCPHCGTHLAKRNLKRTKRYPVQVGYKCCGKGNKEQTALPMESDLEVLKDIESEGVPKTLWYPIDSFPVGINTRQPIAVGIDTVDKVYTPRALWAMAYLWNLANNYPNSLMRDKLMFTLTSLYQRVTVFSEFRFWGGSGNTANYNVPQIMNEQNVFTAFRRKAGTIGLYFRHAPRVPRHLHVSVKSACHIDHLPDKSVDFIFTDPPFGGNINYSEMNFLWESWLRRHTDNTEEAIVNKTQNKNVVDYQSLLTQAFLEANRVLRTDGWMCVVFHNSSEKVWKALQKVIINSGFEVLAAQMLDKQHGTFKMFVSDNAVGYDIILHCRKFLSSANPSIDNLSLASMDSVRNFIRQRLSEPNKYRIHYLHVARNDEFDYRRLFSEWLCSSFSNAEINVDFELFRNMVNEVRMSKNVS